MRVGLSSPPPGQGTAVGPGDGAAALSRGAPGLERGWGGPGGRRCLCGSGRRAGAEREAAIEPPLLGLHPGPCPGPCLALPARAGAPRGDTRGAAWQQVVLAGAPATLNFFLFPSKQAIMSDRKAVIKNADMSEEMQQDSVECATQALEKYNIEKDIAAHIKKEFDKKYNPTWHCIVGRNFGSYVTHETKHFIYFYLGQVAILLFKSG
uniref:Dynein light chain 1, cytoplasmic n=1 Tax=Geospiza parvula TaxID=87175 RepID=A0A8C3MRU9_GEOPR